ncbi:Ubiquitin carboxyl-terminal hydrolase 2 [Camponotus floridanus]|uniref:Ubiquitin carboxyl-terminal hydrolase n=1 Tax=Camponotus floridanus TaxID=104421 RepID=E2AIV3_CAMFO|nr:Ubiquitin carboxyl-terminal hydrolase 2 [Camponotus floridanus]
MSYHRSGQTGAVAVSYSTSPMPHSPNRRYSSGPGSGGAASSGIGGATSKFNTYRSSVAGTSSLLDRPTTSFYSPSSAGLHSSYISSEYRRSYCPPSRSVSSSSYGETGGGVATSTVNGTSSGRYSSTSSSSRERKIDNVDAAADIISRYSPSSYVPNIQRQQQASSGSAHHWRHRSTSSSLNELFGGDEREAERRDLRPESSLSSSSSSSSAAVASTTGAVGGLWSKSTNKRRPIPTNSTVLTIAAGHARADSAASLAEMARRKGTMARMLLASVAGRPSVTHGDDPSVPSTSRRTDQSALFSNTGHQTSSPTNPSTAHQSIYRSVNEQYAIGWALWCLWTAISLVSAYAFFLGIATPLISYKRISTRINSTRVDNSAIIPLRSISHTVQSSSFVSHSQEGNPTNRSTRNRLQISRDERCGLNGLRNIGNTCFMNSVIQCLSNTRPLLEYLLNEQYLADINTTTSSMKGALIKAFSQVIHELWEVGGDHVVNTTALKSQIQRFAPRFMGYSQQDAQEFLRYLLEGLHEDVNRVTTKLPPIHGDIPDSYTDMQKAVESWKRYLRSEDSMIVDVFVGQLRSSLHCTSCDHVSVTLDPFWDLSLPIPGRSGTVKLSQCLEHFTREEVLDGDEKPTCSKCQMRRKCTKSFSIQKFPKILVIHLKRFSPMERFRGKLNVMVDFPLTGLDLSAFAAPRVPGCTYNLYGVANHSGTTYSGHYTAYCKHPYSGEWHEYNDSRVSVVSSRSVVSSEAYVLFYEQQPHSSHL